MSIPLEIADASVTQQASDISLIYPYIYYNNTETGNMEFIDQGALKVEAALGAILRGSINPDPSSCYPFPGRGFPADNDLQVENKENTAAANVTYFGVLPLVSPLTDGTDQSTVATSMEFYKKYY